MFKLDITHNTKYGEVAQVNPLRWRIMHRDKKTLTSQSGLIKCRDFFNDVVAWKQAQYKFGIYSFQNDVKFNKAGLYFHLTNIDQITRFKKNIAVLNKRLLEDCNTKLSVYTQGSKQVVLHIPNALWESTYQISAVSMLIRVANYKYEFTDWDSIFSDESPLCTIETSFSADAKALVKAQGFKVPEKATGCWYYDINGFNSKSKTEFYNSIIHNNGCSRWAAALK